VSGKSARRKLSVIAHRSRARPRRDVPSGIAPAIIAPRAGMHSSAVRRQLSHGGAHEGFAPRQVKRLSGSPCPNRSRMLNRANADDHDGDEQSRTADDDLDHQRQCHARRSRAEHQTVLDYMKSDDLAHGVGCASPSSES